MQKQNDPSEMFKVLGVGTRLRIIEILKARGPIGVSDIEAACAKVRELGGAVVREPGPMKHGSTVIAFVEDPDGYKIEFIEGR